MNATITGSAERPPVAPLGSLVLVRIAASLVCREGDRGYLVAVTGAELRIHEQNIIETLGK